LLSKVYICRELIKNYKQKTIMKKINLLLLALVTVFMISCEEAAATAEESTEAAVEVVEETATEATEVVEEAAQEGAEAVEGAVEEVKEEVAQ